MIDNQQRYADLSAAGKILWKAVVALIAEETAFGPATQKVNRALAYIRTQQGHILDGKTEDGAEIVETPPVNQDGLTIGECVDFALMNERESGKKGLWMSKGAAAVYADQYGFGFDVFEAELQKRGWDPEGGAA